MALINAKAVVNGQEADVQIDDEKFLPIEVHKTRLEHTIQERLGRKETEVVSRLEKDEEFWKKLAKARGFDPEKRTELDGAAAERLRKDILESEVTPLQQKLQETTQFAESLIDSRKRAELEAAFKGVAKPGLVDLLVERFAKDFHFDPKTKSFGMKDANGEWIFGSSANAKTPYRGITELVQQWAKDAANADFLATPARQGGAGMGAGATGSTDDLMKLPPAQRLAEARRRGLTK